MDKLILISEEHGAFELEPAEGVFLIGRRKGCDLVLSDSSVSRQHAEVLCRAGRWYIRDAHSKHGTYVNGVAAHKPVALEGEDQIQLGAIVMVACLEPESGSDGSSPKRAGKADA